MNTYRALVSLVALAVTVQVSAAGDVTGTITVKGTPPKEKDITPLKEDPNCGKFHSAMPTTRFYAVGENNALGDVVISLEGSGIGGKSTGASAPAVVLDQKNCIYVPQILAVQTGQKVTVKNSDPVLHNVHSQPTANPEDNKAQMPNGPELNMTFAKPEEFIKFKCDVHPWMFAWVSVFDHPYYSVSGKDGTFKIANVPPGKYKLKANHRKAGIVTKDIEVTADGAKVDVAMDAK